VPGATLLSALPLATLVAVEAYVAGFDGWGAWGAAPLLLLPAILGLTIGFGCVADVARARRAGRTTSAHWLRVGVALAPVGWLFVRRLIL
jgi:hypothetical protein